MKVKVKDSNIYYLKKGIHRRRIILEIIGKEKL